VNRKKTIYRLLTLAFWLAILGGMTTLLIAADKRKVDRKCSSVRILIEGESEQVFIQQADIRKEIELVNGGTLEGKAVTDFNLGSLENNLLSNPWIREAELYFDNREVLNIIIRERKPIARLINADGSSFYIDSAGKLLPLLDQVPLRLTVFTGFRNPKRWNAADSLLMKEVRMMATFISGHPFWNAQIPQVDITPDMQFELMPLVGDHIIRFGRAADLDLKFDNLYVFYKQVLHKAGLRKYSVVDVRYKNQVVAVNRGETSKADSIALEKNIRELIEAGMKETEQTRPAENIQETKSLDENHQVPLKTTPDPNLKTSEKPERQPKAVMKKKTV
jgi:cell division protein FtsQ